MDNPSSFDLKPSPFARFLTSIFGDRVELAIQDMNHLASWSVDASAKTLFVLGIPALPVSITYAALRLAEASAYGQPISESATLLPALGVGAVALVASTISFDETEGSLYDRYEERVDDALQAIDRKFGALLRSVTTLNRDDCTRCHGPS